MLQEKAPRPTHHYPVAVVAPFLGAWLAGRHRPFAADAARLARTLAPAPDVQGLENIPATGRLIAIYNHYYSPTFPSWWQAIVTAALLHQRRPLGPDDLSWVVASTWTYPDWLRAHTVAPLSEIIFRRLAAVYGFVSMPPMPPRPQDVEARARAVHQLLALARAERPAVIGFSPEGHDSPDASLLEPPAGVGRLLLHFAATGRALLPVGMWEESGRLHVRVGPPFFLQAPADLPRERRGEWAAAQTMASLARLLPETMRGAYR